ncbi:MAG: TetR/AcrR family transcriptional regulator [Sporichthyaceae bacterium]
MAPRTGGSREQMLATAVRLFQRDGYAATSWRGLVEEAGTPWGSAHHHFPGGKEQLGVEAVELGAAMFREQLAAAFADGDPVAAVRAVFAATAASLLESGFETGCPIATVSLETSTGPRAVAQACGGAFGGWRDEIAAGLVRAGADRDGAGRLASLVIASFEGAVLLAKAWHDVAPVEEAGEAMAALIAAELA